MPATAASSVGSQVKHMIELQRANTHRTDWFHTTMERPVSNAQSPLGNKVKVGENIEIKTQNEQINSELRKETYKTISENKSPQTPTKKH
eukprot:4617377-Amphidinium_carterae.1